MIIFYFIILSFGVCSGQSCFHDSEMIRPCPRLDSACVRDFFAKHGDCKPAFGSISEVQYPGKIAFSIPHANLTFIWKDLSFSGFDDTQIKEFYLNRKTGNLVFEAEVREGTLSSRTVTIRYYFKGREPLELTDFITVTFRKVSMTATMPYDSVNGISWGKRDIYGYFGDADFPFSGGSGHYNSDPVVLAAYNEMAVNMQLGVRESASVLGPLYFDTYFNDNICKF